MKQLIATVVTALLLCSYSAAFAEDVLAPDNNQPQAGSNPPDQAQPAIDMLKNMPPEQRQQLFQAGVAQIKNISPEQMGQLKARYDSLTPEQKNQLQEQIIQQLQNSPQLKAQAEEQLQKLTPAQTQQLTDTNQK